MEGAEEGIPPEEPEAEPEAEPEVEPEPEAEAEAEPEPEAAPETEPEAAPEPELEPEAEAKASEEEDNAAAAALEACTSDDTHSAPSETLDMLSEAAESLAGDEATQLADWLSNRLGLDSIPVKLKTLKLLGLLIDSAAAGGNAALQDELRARCGEAVTAAGSFDKVDPDHGTKPAELIRQTAASVSDKLAGEAGTPRQPDQSVRGTVVGVGADHSADDLFEAALKRRKQKAEGGGGAVSLCAAAQMFCATVDRARLAVGRRRPALQSGAGRTG